MSLPSDFTILSLKLEARVAEEEGQAKVETSPEPEEEPSPKQHPGRPEVLHACSTARYHRVP